MTDLSLQDSLAEELKKLFADAGRKMPWAKELKGIRVFTQQLPLKETDGYQDVDGDFGDQWNYVCIVLGDENLKDGQWNVEVHFAVGIKDLGKDCQGHRNVANILNEIFLHFVKLKVIRGYYSMDTETAFKKYAPDDEYPYYQGDLITCWTMPAPQPEGLEGLI